jgi:hypothetical protein
MKLHTPQEIIFIVQACNKLQKLKIQIYMIQCRHTSNLNIINLLRVLSGNSRKISTLGLPQGLAEKGERPF